MIIGKTCRVPNQSLLNYNPKKTLNEEKYTNRYTLSNRIRGNQSIRG